MKNEKIILGTAQFGNKYGIANTKILKKDNYYKILDYALKKNIKISINLCIVATICVECL